jgi:hypothetical protein
MAFCTKCGTQLSEGYAFCTNCGEKQEGQNAIVAPTGGAIEGKEMIPQSPETRQSRQAVIEKPTSTQAIGKNLVRGLLVLALIGVISAITIPALLGQRSKLKAASRVGMLPDGEGNPEDLARLVKAPEIGSGVKVQEFIVNYNDVLVACTNEWLATGKGPGVETPVMDEDHRKIQLPLLRKIDQDSSLQIFEPENKQKISILCENGSLSYPAWKNDASTYMWLWLNSSKNISMIKCSAKSIDKVLRTFGIDEYKYYSSSEVAETILAAQGKISGLTTLKFPLNSGWLVTEFFVIKKPSGLEKEPGVFVRVFAVNENITDVVAREPKSVVSLGNGLNQGSYAWYLTFQVEPHGQSILSLPLNQIDPTWIEAELLTIDKMPPEGRKELADNPGYEFIRDIDIDKDGKPEKLLVGVFKNRDGKKGKFLLALKIGQDGKYSKLGLVTSENSGFSAIFQKADSVLWTFGIGSDDNALVSFQNGALKAEFPTNGDDDLNP